MRRALPCVFVLVAAMGVLTSSSSTSARTVADGRAAAGDWTSRTVYEDDFSGTRLHRGWSRYDGPYSSGAENYARPDHFFLNGRGKLVLLLKYRTSGDDGAAWYSGGAMLKEAYGGRFQAIDIRYKVVSRGVRSNRNIPIRWVDDPDYEWYEGETNFNEGSDLGSVYTFLHYGPDDQVSKGHRVDLTKWHRWRFVHTPDRRIQVFLDGTLRWDYQGTATTVPDAFRRIVLQQEVASSEPPPPGKGTERILIDYMRVQTLTPR